CIDCFDLHLGTEDCRHCQICGWNAKDMMDCSSAGKNAEILYEMHAAANATQHCAFVSFVRSCEHVYYSENMALCKHCFGCIGLNRKQFCILNRQHTEQEYFELVETIITHMQRMKEWGEFFPITVSPFCYNETLAHEHFPLSKEEALAKGWKWKDVTGDSPKLERTISAKELPTTITEVKDDILDVAILCEATHKPFRIVKQELDFYRRMELPLPQFHPEERHRRRMIQRTPYRLWSRTCQKCQKEIQTSYAPDRPEFVVCEECYLKEIY
ncbi:hypothetical protein HY213_03030, partial [Candidatus Peregrinibacteria bacterium]|nr:hypothetical protein [Candidatus Peregrinibacteria bacterium]